MQAAAVLLIAAHPDDEIIGAGISLAEWHPLVIVHATDGSPASMADALRLGFATRAEYARTRREELTAALEVAGGSHAQLVELGIPDQEAAHNLEFLTGRIAALLREHRPKAIMAHPYEGGHPDHDACALATAAAAALTGSGKRGEFSSYHAGGESIRTGVFLGNAAYHVRELSDQERERKRRALDCFASQRETLAAFRECASEQFRAAPEYDFTAPPHSGTLYYERFPWGMTGSEFRRLAARALRNLGLERAA